LFCSKPPKSAKLELPYYPKLNREEFSLSFPLESGKTMESCVNFYVNSCVNSFEYIEYCFACAFWLNNV
jgi:hypothetical protein